VQGRPGGRCTRGLAQKEFAQAQEPQVQAVITPAFPARWFTTYVALSSVNLADCHRHRRDALASSAQRQPLGRQDHAFSSSASVLLVGQHIRVHRIPASHLVTIAKRPSASEAGWHDEMLIFGILQVKYFCRENLTPLAPLIPLGKFRFARVSLWIREPFEVRPECSWMPIEIGNRGRSIEGQVDGHSNAHLGFDTREMGPHQMEEPQPQRRRNRYDEAAALHAIKNPADHFAVGDRFPAG
jgi:hypothetical protein